MHLQMGHVGMPFTSQGYFFLDTGSVQLILQEDAEIGIKNDRDLVEVLHNVDHLEPLFPHSCLTHGDPFRQSRHLVLARLADPSKQSVAVRDEGKENIPFLVANTPDCWLCQSFHNDILGKRHFSWKEEILLSSAIVRHGCSCNGCRCHGPLKCRCFASLVEVRQEMPRRFLRAWYKLCGK